MWPYDVFRAFVWIVRMRCDRHFVPFAGSFVLQVEMPIDPIFAGNCATLPVGRRPKSDITWLSASSCWVLSNVAGSVLVGQDAAARGAARTLMPRRPKSPRPKAMASAATALLARTPSNDSACKNATLTIT